LPVLLKKKEDADVTISEKDAVRIAEATLRNRGMLYDKYEVETCKINKDEWRITISAAPGAPGQVKVVTVTHSGKTVIIEPGL